MSNYANLKSAIQSVIKTNGNNEITGQLLQNELLAMITTLGYGYQFMGIANPDTVPGTPDAKVFYIAYTPGTYTNFNGISVTGLCVLKYATGWVKEDILVTGGGTDIAVESTDLTLLSGDPNKLKFADRLRESNITTGKNYIILRENATFAQQVTISNAIYEIRYDFDLNNASFTVPANSVLKFVGGKLTNGTLVGNNTAIDADIVQIFGTDITLSGSWNLISAYPEWYGAVADGSTDCTTAIQKLDGFPIKFSYGTYIVSNVVLHGKTMLIGCGIKNTTIKQKANSVDDMIILQNWIGGSMQGLTILGNESATLSGNGLECALVKIRALSQSPQTYSNYSSIDNVLINGVGNPFNGLSLLGSGEIDNGVTCVGNWIFHISNIWVASCGRYGIYDASSDNLFNTINVSYCGLAHIMEKGSSNMWVNAKLDGNFIGTLSGTDEEILQSDTSGALLIINSGGIVNMSNIDLQDSKYCGCKIVRCQDSKLEISANYIGHDAPGNIDYSKNFYIKTATRCVLRLCVIPYGNQTSCVGFYRSTQLYLNEISIFGSIRENDWEVLRRMKLNNIVHIANSGIERKPNTTVLSNTIVLNNIFLKNIANDNDDSYFSYSNATKETTNPLYANTKYVLMDNSATQLLRGITKKYPVKAIRKDSLYLAVAVIRVDKVPTGTSQQYPYFNTNFGGNSSYILNTVSTNPANPNVGDTYFLATVFSYALNSEISAEFIQAGTNLYLAAASNGKFSIGNFCLYKLDNVKYNNFFNFVIESTPPANSPFTTDLIIKVTSDNGLSPLVMDSVSRDSLDSVAVRRDNGRIIFDTTYKELVYYDGEDWISGSTGLKLAKRSGAFTAKPTFTAGTNAGFLYFDTTNNKYIVWNGTDWTNVDGSALSQ